jgi:four helix bundle protein
MTAGHKSLDVWKMSMDLVTRVYEVTKHFPKDELYGLTSQIRRAAVSIPSNIAEGRARTGTRDYMRFVSIARGSAAELETQLLISKNLSYLTEDALTPLYADVNRVGRMLSGLISKLESHLSSRNGTQPPVASTPFSSEQDNHA